MLTFPETLTMHFHKLSSRIGRTSHLKDHRRSKFHSLGVINQKKSRHHIVKLGYRETALTSIGSTLILVTKFVAGVDRRRSVTSRHVYDQYSSKCIQFEASRLTDKRARTHVPRCTHSFEKKRDKIKSNRSHESSNSKNIDLVVHYPTWSSAMSPHARYHDS